MSNLIEALRDTYEINCTVQSREAIERTISTCADYFISRNVGHAWAIVSVELATTCALLYNEGRQIRQKQLGLLTSATLATLSSLHNTLWIIECDKFTPNYIYDMARAHTAGGLSGQIVTLTHQDYDCLR